MTSASFETAHLPIRPLVLLRTVRLTASPGRVDGIVADNVHEFGVRLLHDGRAVTEVSGQAIRVPWTTCPGAIERLQDLIGTPLSRSDRRPVPAIDKGQQCTHLFDLAKLAVAQASRGGDRFYRIRIHDEDDVIVATIHRDGQPIFTWRVIDNRVVNPGPFLDHVIFGAAQWSEEAARDPDLVEAGMSVRRALLVFKGHRRNRVIQNASQLPNMAGACFSFQPARMGVAVRPPDFRDVPGEERETPGA